MDERTLVPRLFPNHGAHFLSDVRNPLRARDGNPDVSGIACLMVTLTSQMATTPGISTAADKALIAIDA